MTRSRNTRLPARRAAAELLGLLHLFGLVVLLPGFDAPAPGGGEPPTDGDEEAEEEEGPDEEEWDEEEE